MTSASLAQRSLAFWFPDWPVTARSLTTPSGISADAAVAIVHANLIVACSAPARAAGVKRGQRKRDAQAACAYLQIFSHEPERDARAFSPVVSRIEALAPGVHIFRPGLCMLSARGPSRYYGGEREAAQILIDAVTEHGITDVRVGIADGPFAAEQAARTALPDAPDHRVRVVNPDESAGFLAPLPVTLLDDAAVVSLLSRLGVHTLGAFATLDEGLVRDRFSERGVRLHALAAGRDPRVLTARIPPPDFMREVTFEPPLELAEQVAFAVRQSVDDFMAALAGAALVCTEIRVEFTDDRDLMTDRVWLHPTFFDAGAIVDRVRWQLQAVWEQKDQTLPGAITRVRLFPHAVDKALNHQPSLLGHGVDTRVHHALSRVQALLGHRGVMTAEVVGGRLLNDRHHLVPWGDRIPAPTQREQPWPGHLPAPLPATLFDESGTLDVLSTTGLPITVDERGQLNAVPALIVRGPEKRQISSWAGPWPLIEKIWIATEPRYRFHAVDEKEVAWVLLCTSGRWQAEGRYD